jgi:uncharacterized membrane protein YfcA
LDAILIQEESHLQWFKHGLCAIVLFAQVAVNVSRGSKTTPSLFSGIGYAKCTWYDFTLCGLFLILCAIFTMLAIRRVNYEQYYKVKYNKGICKSDLKFSPDIVRRLVTVAFAGGWVSGALGLGGGAIFNPVLLSMGIPPAVSSSTGMYLVMFTTLGSSITYLLQ